MHESKQILILDLLEVLKKYSDEEHGLTQQQILDILKNKYGYKTVQRKTVKNNLEKLRSYTKKIDGELVRTRDVTKKFDEEENKVKVYSNFHYKHEFNEGELRLLIDSILFSKQMSSSKKRDMIKKLERLASKHFNSRKNHISTEENIGLTDSQLFENIKKLDEAITNSKKLTFNYNRHTINNKYEISFEPEKNEDGSPKTYTINPYHIVATNGRYYLVCNNDQFNNVSHYRIDRISHITILPSDRKPMKKVKGLEDGLSLPNYMKEHIYLFAGESIRASIRFKKRLISEFIDWFGLEGVYFSKQMDGEVTATFNVNRNSLRKWALQYGLYFKVVEPEDLVADIKRDIEQVVENYK